MNLANQVWRNAFLVQLLVGDTNIYRCPRIQFTTSPLKSYTLKDLAMINEGKVTIELSDEAKTKIERCREYLDQEIKRIQSSYLWY